MVQFKMSDLCGRNGHIGKPEVIKCLDLCGRNGHIGKPEVMKINITDFAQPYN